jgi:hypothetical protein
MLPPGGFFMIGVLLLVANWHDLTVKARAKAMASTARPAPPRSTPEPERVPA